MTGIRQDLARTTLAVISLVLLIVGSLWVLRPFLAATIWATMLVVATWPILESVEARLGKRRAPAVAVMTLGMVFLLVLPIWLAFDTISGHTGDVSALAKRLAETGLPKAPEWVSKVPFVGAKLTATLDDWSAAGPAGLEARLRPYASDAARWAVSGAGSLGGTLVQLVLVVLLATVMYSSGEGGAACVVSDVASPVNGARTRSSSRERPYAALRWASVSPPSFRPCWGASASPWPGFRSPPCCRRSC
jgi:predicted PurR-regulated permease PerM